MGTEVLVGRYLLPGTGASFKNAFRAQKRTTVSGVRACSRRGQRERRNLFLFVWKRYAAVNGSSGARMFARNERSTLFSCAHHDLFHPIASITQTLRRARVIDAPPPAVPAIQRTRIRCTLLTIQRSSLWILYFMIARFHSHPFLSSPFPTFFISVPRSRHHVHHGRIMSVFSMVL